MFHWDASQALAGNSVPTLVLSGEADIVTKPGASLHIAQVVQGAARSPRRRGNSRSASTRSTRPPIRWTKWPTERRFGGRGQCRRGDAGKRSAYNSSPARGMVSKIANTLGEGAAAVAVENKSCEF
jgi:hypothetical protein